MKNLRNQLFIENLRVSIPLYARNIITFNDMDQLNKIVMISRVISFVLIKENN
jgi:hypothetical protein